MVTGAESTGKSALAEWLAGYLRVPFIPEFAREYIEKLPRRYTYQDVENIARKQVEQLNAMRKTTHPFIISDTWLIITKIWFEVVFNRLPSWLDGEIEKTPVDLFLVCDTDLPWKPDPVRENGGKQREILQKKYMETIEKFGFSYRVVLGKEGQRFNNALQYVQQLDPPSADE